MAEQANQNYNFREAEARIRSFWEKEKIFSFNPNSKKPMFSVDTPPPTVSGKMHIGHAFSYAQQDFLIRYKRMAGNNIFYPFGTDDNGLPTERLIEKLKKVRGKEMNREEFIKLCLDTLGEIRHDFINNWKKVGISADFNILYSTIDNRCRKLAQWSFLDLYKKSRLYQKKAASIYCPECQTAIAQAELKDKDIKSKFNDIVFKVQGKELIISTTRPELLPSCVAVFYNPSDKRYKNLKSKKAKVPLFNFEVPILEDEKADPEKGTGIVMCCTFGDLTDVEWQKAHNLPIKISINPDGRLNELTGEYSGQKIKEARKNIIEALKEAGLLKDQKDITHSVNVHERCDTEIEFLVSEQWFVRYLDLKEKFLEQGNKINWHPEFMKNRYTNWIKGLQWDWCISRQRYFGVPIPVWHCKKCNEILLPEEKDLPVDPIYSQPKKTCKCGSKEFEGEKDVLDTWFTSSLTPQISIDRAEYTLGKKLKAGLYPFSLRPQAHDIITFWAFNTIVKSFLHENKIPWKNIMISGFVTLGGEKMSKSKDNVIEPQPILENYGADALRFWAASSKLGEDFSYSEKDILTAKKFVTKLFNASKFAFMNLQNYRKSKPKSLELMDKWILSELDKIIELCTQNFENYEYARVKSEIEHFFWHTFCDYYLEIIKRRIYTGTKEEKLSAQYTLYTGILKILKVLAPIMPYITEEIYQKFFKENEKDKSIHLSNWPKQEIKDKKAEEVGELFTQILADVRKRKSEEKKGMKAEIILTIEKERLDKLKLVLEDLKAVTSSKEIRAGSFKVEFIQ